VDLLLSKELKVVLVELVETGLGRGLVGIVGFSRDVDCLNEVYDLMLIRVWLWTLVLLVSDT
jgi:hypothetical protein